MSTTGTSEGGDGTGLLSKDEEELIWAILPEAMNDDLLLVARAAGIHAALDIMLTLGGSTIYVPRVEELQRRLRDARINVEYSGGARVKDLSRRYNLTERTIYKVINKIDREG